ncbi:hypothetical protein [Rhodococcus pyridinivorans]|nr:hypothetical protein [Rhodococcus pyridinivorans]
MALNVPEQARHLPEHIGCRFQIQQVRLDRIEVAHRAFHRWAVQDETLSS